MIKSDLTCASFLQELNSSQIDELGNWCLKSWWGRACGIQAPQEGIHGNLASGNYPGSTANRHRHTETCPVEILTKPDTYLLGQVRVGLMNLQRIASKGTDPQQSLECKAVCDLQRDSKHHQAHEPASNRITVDILTEPTQFMFAATCWLSSVGMENSWSWIETGRVLARAVDSPMCTRAAGAPMSKTTLRV